MQGQFQTKHLEKFVFRHFDNHKLWLGEEKTRQNRQTPVRTSTNVGLTASEEDRHPYFPSAVHG